MKYLAQVDIGSKFGSPFGQGKDLGDLVSFAVRGAFVVAGLFILFFILFAGFQVIAGAGQNNPDAAKKGKEAATAALVGFIIVFVAYWIVRIIEALTGVPFITAPTLP